ncbi:MAG: hypothetical protein DDT20_01799 [Firmicutes bacterium]|nr:hypothetical protein [Bacillota bacterium]
MKRGKIAVLLVVIVGLIAVAGYYVTRRTKADYDLADVTGILIYGKFESYIYAHPDEQISIQIPVYDFSNELTGYSVNVTGFDIGQVKIQEMIPQNKFPYFEQHSLRFLLIPQREGVHIIDNLAVVITSARGTYTGSLGRWVFEVEEKTTEESLELRGGSLFLPYTGPRRLDDFQYRSVFRNTSQQKAVLQDLSVHNDRIKLRAKDQFTLEPSADGTLEAYLDISQTVGNAYVRPKLTYVINGDIRARTTSLVLVASTVPKEELVSILREKNMLGD